MVKMRQKAIIVSIFLVLVLASSALLLTVQAQFPSIIVLQGRSIMRWHLDGQSGTAIGQATFSVRQGGHSPTNFYDIRLTVGGVNCYWLVSSANVHGNFVTIQGTPIPKDVMRNSLQVSSPITVIIYNVAPYSVLAFGREVLFVSHMTN